MQAIELQGDAWHVARNWPRTKPMVALLGTGSWVTFLHSFSEASLADLAFPLAGDSSGLAAGPLQSGFCGVLSYDDFCGSCVEPTPSRIFRVFSTVHIEQTTGRVCIGGVPNENADYFIDASEMLQSSSSIPRKNPPPTKFVSRESEAAYLRTIHQICEDIKSGRYYQLNYLRYFSLPDRQNRPYWVDRIRGLGGPYSAIVDVPELSLVSFSPEQFLRGQCDPDGYALAARPIKGTLRRSGSDDSAERQLLLGSQKDAAELNMIVDLMRHDLSSVSRLGSTRVSQRPQVKSFANLHHLEATVSSLAKPSLTCLDLFRQVCPAGSITGAPKTEVMQAITEYEKRARGYFMGNLFYFDAPTRSLNASVLIRTLYAMQGNSYEYAAGSGIVVNSDPESELEEIKVKCRVLSAQGA